MSGSRIAVTFGAGARAAAAESVDLLDGGAGAYPRMLLAIATARKSVHLEVYGFALTGIGATFIAALGDASARGADVRVWIDGWGSARTGLAVAAALRERGCAVRIHNRLRALLVGRFGRNHRKILLVDDVVAFLGGINIGDERARRRTPRMGRLGARDPRAFFRELG